MSAPSYPLGLFAGTGVEIEYMIVDDETLAVKPIADELVRSVVGAYESEIERGELAWSNELALHVIELKTNGPTPSLAGLGAHMQAHAAEINGLLEPLGARLMPTGMHPWMDPHKDFRLWPHEYSRVYDTFNRIFDCRGHGWANLQSVHINLPFANDAEFDRLHAAIRLVLPLLPALAASTPAADGALTGLLDTRLQEYRKNAARIPEVTGGVIPIAASSRAEYEREILQPIYDAVAPLDPDGVLHYEWVNARGAIARFDRGAIEIRLLDVQECPRADLAIVAAVVACVRALVEERHCPLAQQRAWPREALIALLDETIRLGDAAEITDRDFAAAFGHAGSLPCTAGALWAHIVNDVLRTDPHFDEWAVPLQVIASEGCLARRIVNRLGASPDRAAFRAVYAELCECLAHDRLFHAGSA